MFLSVVPLPDGIPSKIMMAGFDHREPLGRESITFKLAERKSQEDLKEWEGEMLELRKNEFRAAIEAFKRPLE